MNRHRRPARWLVGTLAVAALLAAACGGDDDDTAPPEAPTTQEETESEPTAPEEPSATTADDSSATVEEEPTTTTADDETLEEPTATTADDVPTGPDADQGDISELLPAAQAEGKVVYMSSSPQVVGQQTADAFKERFGIEVEFISLNAAELAQRYEAEAAAGNISADVITLTSAAFTDNSIAQGWTIPLVDAGLPVLELGTYPEGFFFDDHAIVQIRPFGIWYNTDTIDPADAPVDLGDLADPKYKGLINIPDVAASDAFVQFFELIRQEYGEEWFEGFVANEPRVFPSVSAGAQAIAAGEGGLVVPAVHAAGVPLIEAGAPLERVVPPVTTGPADSVLMTNPELAPHPNAARLFTNWLLSESGSLAAAGDLTDSPYNKESLPSGFVLVESVTPEMRSNILSLLNLPG